MLKKKKKKFPVPPRGRQSRCRHAVFFLEGQRRLTAVAVVVERGRPLPNPPPQKKTSDTTRASQFNNRVLVLAGIACLGAVAAVCSLLVTGIPLHAITTDTTAAAAAAGLGSVSKDRNTRVVTTAHHGADGNRALDHAGRAFQEGDAFVPVPRLREDDEPQPLAGPAAAAATADADATDKTRWGRRLASDSTPLSAALLDFDAGGGNEKRGGSGRRERHGGRGVGGGGRSGATKFLVRDQGGDDAQTGDEDDEDDMCEYDFEATEDDGGGLCSPLEVVGLDSCPEMRSRGVVRKLLAAKADILRQVNRPFFPCCARSLRLGIRFFRVFLMLVLYRDGGVQDACVFVLRMEVFWRHGHFSGRMLINDEAPKSGLPRSREPHCCFRCSLL